MKKESLREVERKGLKRTNLPVQLPNSITRINQSNIVTRMSYDYQIVQLRALIAVIEKFQMVIRQAINKEDTSYQLSLFNDADDESRFIFEIPLREFGIAPSHYNKLRESLKNMATIPVEIEYVDPNTGDRYIHITGLMEAYIPERFERSVRIKMYKKVANLLLNVDKGFTSFIKEIAFKAKSKYTIRFYMLISSWKDRGGFSITYAKLRNWLKIGKKYSEYKDFYRNVIRPAYEELFEKSDVWFEVSEIYMQGEKEPYKLNFKVVKGRTNTEEEELLNKYKLSIDGMLSTHLALDTNHRRNIIRLVTIDNYQAMVEKIRYLKEYIPGKKIKDPFKYCVRAFNQDFDRTPVGEDLEDES